MRRHPVKRRRLGDQQRRRLQVLRGARRRRQLGRNRLLHDRVHERQAFAGSEQLDAPQLVGRCLARARVRVPRAPPRVAEASPDRAPPPPARVARIPGRAWPDERAGCVPAPRPQRPHLAGQLDGRASALGPECRGQRLQIERVAARRLSAGATQLVVCARAQFPANQHPGAELAQRRRPQDRVGDGGQGGHHADRVSPLPGPGSGKQEHGQRLDPSCQIQQETSRRRVDPVRVVEDEQQGAAIGEIGDQPVEAVQHRADAIAGLAHIRDDLEHRRGELRGPGEQSNPAARDARPEKLSDGGERRLHRHLIAPRPQHRQTEPHPSSRRTRPTATSSRSRPDPRPGRTDRLRVELARASHGARAAPRRAQPAPRKRPQDPSRADHTSAPSGLPGHVLARSRVRSVGGATRRPSLTNHGGSHELPLGPSPWRHSRRPMAA